MHPDVLQWIEVLWIVFLVAWGIGALTQKQTVRKEAGRSRLVHLLLGALAGIVLFDKRLNFGILERPFVPQDIIFSYLGLTLTFAGIAFALWARVFLGRNWSGAVTVKKDHELVRTGPYALARHPIYTGVLLALLGTVIDLRQARGLLALGIAVLAFSIKMRREELFMAEQFGAAYAEYKQKVKALVPFVW